MKNRSRSVQLLCFFISTTLYVLMLFWDTPPELNELQAVLLLSFPAVPVFCLQLWLCRLENVRWFRWLPLCVLLLVSLVGAAYFFGLAGSGWDAVGGGVLLCWCIAPAAGCTLGWLAYGGKLPRILGAVGLAALLIIYVVLKIIGGPHPFFLRFEPMDLPALAVLSAGIWLLLRKKRR